jgi:hypothetical protein
MGFLCEVLFEFGKAFFDRQAIRITHRQRKVDAKRDGASHRAPWRRIGKVLAERLRFAGREH